jgi:hypothetical protein
MSELYLRGAHAIAKELVRLGIIAEDDPNPEDKVYYLNRSGKLSLDRFGAN